MFGNIFSAKVNEKMIKHYKIQKMWKNSITNICIYKNKALHL